jgi:hypothetical protein
MIKEWRCLALEKQKIAPSVVQCSLEFLKILKSDDL